jgi:hypothetical protein
MKEFDGHAKESELYHQFLYRIKPTYRTAQKRSIFQFSLIELNRKGALLYNQTDKVISTLEYEKAKAKRLAQYTTCPECNEVYETAHFDKCPECAQ